MNSSVSGGVGGHGRELFFGSTSAPPPLSVFRILTHEIRRTAQKEHTASGPRQDTPTHEYRKFVCVFPAP